MVVCKNCDTLFDESEIISVTVKGLTYAVCPECLMEFLEEAQNDLVDVSPQEEKYICNEWEADERYDEMKLRGAV